MEQKLLSPGPLLDGRGNLVEAGYAKSLVKEYDRRLCRGGTTRVKEWDYYYIGNDRYGVALTVADNSYMSLVSASVMDFAAGTFTTDSEMKPFSGGRLNLPASSERGVTRYHSKRVDMEFVTEEEGSRSLVASFRRWGKAEGAFSCRFCLSPGGESMAIATPFRKARHFYYNQKINCMPAEGAFCADGEEHALNGLAVLDWGRGVWTYRNTWYWGSLSATVDGHRFGFNIGYGFGDTSAATENMLFYDGRAHKLDSVAFHIPKNAAGKEDYLSEWRFTSSDKRLELTFRPILDRKDKMSVGIIATDQHQVFGKFYGIAVLDDGTEVRLNGETGFAEKVFNKW